MKASEFNIYNASAGSGKTFSIVRDYLIHIFSSNRKYPFRHLLAITFTNKAVNEMKSRIIDTLIDFSEINRPCEETEMLAQVSSALGESEDHVKKKSYGLLLHLLFNYGTFNVSTIDKFNQSLIRLFAFDLKIPTNFEVELDTKQAISKAVDKLISKTGEDEVLTELFLDFAGEKTDSDRSFDLKRDFNKVGILLTDETHLEHIERLENRSIEDFKILGKKLKDKITDLEKAMKEIAINVLETLEEKGFGDELFPYKTLPNHFRIFIRKYISKDPYDNQLEKNLTEGTFYKKIKDENLIARLEDLRPFLYNSFKEIQGLYYDLKFYENYYQNTGKLVVLHLLKKELDLIQQEDEIVLISEFNKIINDHIKLQDIPFIYERLGERFDKFFIDEFQDTSVLQWENIIPLVGNALASENGSLTLVGDAKQAIYRWRGGKAEQFVDLYTHKTNPFHIKAKKEPLKWNYRSFKSVIKFNNDFFQFIATHFLNEETQKKLYGISSQNSSKNEEGYVELSFIDYEKDDKEMKENFAAICLEKIHEVIDDGFQLRDICILVRSNRDGVFLSNYITEFSDLPVMTSESLLIYNNPEVRFVISLLKYIDQPHNKEFKIELLLQLLYLNRGEHLEAENIDELNKLDDSDLFDKLKEYGFEFNLKEIKNFSLYELVEYIIHAFHLYRSPNAYLFQLLDELDGFIKMNSGNPRDFLGYFELKKKNISIKVSEELNAIQIMTIHKSKGLEFPVVIYPFGNFNLNDKKDETFWYKLESDEFEPFEYAYLKLTNNFQHFNDQAAEIYERRMNEIMLDNANLVYVSFTRAIERLYVFGDLSSSKPTTKTIKLSNVLKDFLATSGEWEENKTVYSFGKKEVKKSSSKTLPKDSEFERSFSTPIKDLPIKLVTNSSKLWNSKQRIALERGNLIHDLMSKIRYHRDLEWVLGEELQKGDISLEQKAMLKPLMEELMNHSELNEYFNAPYSVFNEREIITPAAEFYRPDRVVVDTDGNAVIMDYKTGVPKKEDEDQIEQYRELIGQMNLKVEKCLLIYLNEELEIKEV